MFSIFEPVTHQSWSQACLLATSVPAIPTMANGYLESWSINGSTPPLVTATTSLMTVSLTLLLNSMATMTSSLSPDLMMPHLLVMALAVMMLCPIILVVSFGNYTTLITSFLSPITVIMEAIAFHTSIFQNNSVLIICSFVIVISSQNNCGLRSSARGRAQQLDIFPL